MALQDDAMNQFFGWQSAGGENPIQDIVSATFDPSGVAHQKYTADQAAAAQAKIDYAAQQAKYQQDLQAYQQESARIAAANAARLAQSQAVTAAPAAAPAATTAPSSFRDYLIQQGYNRKTWQGTSPAQAAQLRQQYGTIATPEAPKTIAASREALKATPSGQGVGLNIQQPQTSTSSYSKLPMV